MPNGNGYTLKMEISEQTMYDGVRNSCRWLNSEEKRLFGEVCIQSFDSLKSKARDMGEELDGLSEMQCNIVSKGKRYYLPVLVGDYDAKLTILCKTWLRLILLE